MPARVGQSLLNVAQLHKIDIEGPCGGGGGPTSVRRTENWVETTYGEGPTCFYCHVQISSKYNSILPEESQHQMLGLSHVWDDEATRTSRLACMIELDKRHDGMIIFVPDAPVTDVV